MSTISNANEEQKIMKCVTVAVHGSDIDKLVSMSTSRAIPIRRENKGELLIRVEACSLAPGDVRVLKGHCDYFQSPGRFPYIPGGDLSGIVEAADEDSRFKAGDAVMTMFELPRPLNGLAEFAVVRESLTEFRPRTISAVEASALPSSATTAMMAAKSFVKRGDRVLVLGGSGGVGTFFVQLAIDAGASFIAATSTDGPLLKSLGVDRVIDYREENWWELDEFRTHPFDMILDTVGGRDPWIRAMNTGTLKNGWRGGRYVVMNGDEPLMKIHNLCQALKFGCNIEGRILWTKLWPFVPRYVWHSEGLNIKEGTLEELSKLVDGGKVKVVMDPVSPVPFDIEKIRNAFRLMESRHAHGKVVVQVSHPEPHPDSS